MIGSRLLIVVAAILISVLLLAAATGLGLWCFGYSVLYRDLPRGYYLDQDINGPLVYYVGAPGKTVEGGGVFDGTVREIGWNDDWIVAKVIRTASCDPNGWYTLNTRTGVVSGPATAATVQADLARWHIRLRKPLAIFAKGTFGDSGTAIFQWGGESR